MAELLEIILSEIRASGAITFERFMELALYHPEYGYYMKTPLPFGPEGDYYTSGHLPLFGETLALQAIELAEVLSQDELTIVEVGPGMGYLAQGLLNELRSQGMMERFWYILVEMNPYLRDHQQRLLAPFSHRLLWQSIAELQDIQGLIILNEVLDALPVHLIQYENGRFQEVYVVDDSGRLRETLGPLSNGQLKAYIDRYNIPEISHYRTEINLRAETIVSTLATLLHQGLVLIIDYGYSAREYYAPERTRGTLLCYHKHRADESVYETPGQKDITAHVNFSAVKHWAERANFRVEGYTSQGSYLVGLGIDKLIEQRLQQDPEFIRKLPAVKGLLFGMGDTHQVMALSKGIKVPPLRGFTISNRIETL